MCPLWKDSVPITDEVKELIKKAVRKAGSKRYLAELLGYWSHHRQYVIRYWLNGRTKTIRLCVYEKLRALAEE